MTKQLDDLEVFDILQALFPGKYTDDDFDNLDDICIDEFEVDFEQFAKIGGALLTLAPPAMKSPLTDKVYRCFGTSDGEGRFTAVAQIEV